MVTSNILRGSILALIPIAAVLGIITKLGIPFLYAVSFSVGFLQVFFDITYQSYLPSLVRRHQLVEGNRNLQASASTAQVTGPTIAGIIISIVTAPIAIAIDAASFFASAFTLSRIDHDEVLELNIVKPSMKADIREGLHIVFSDRRLRAIAGSTGTSNFFSTALQAIVLLYFVLPSPDGLGVSTSLVGVTAGIIFSVASIGALVGVAISSPAARRIGVGPAIVGSMLIGGFGAIPYYLSGSLTANPPFHLGWFRRQLEYARHHGRPVHHLHRSRSLQRQPSQPETGNSSVPSTRTDERDNALPCLGNNTPRRTRRRITRNISWTAHRNRNSDTGRLAGLSLGSTLSRTLTQRDTCPC